MEDYVQLYFLNFRMTDLPSLEDSAPPIIEKLIFKMLEKHPSSRLSSEEAATICQVLLWAPQAWTSGTIQPTSQQILQWTMTMATKVIYECKFSNSPAAQAEYQLVLSILSRFTIRKIKNALYWITHDGK